MEGIGLTPPATVRAWDAYDAYLFDIDGTLLHCRDAVHYFAFCDALTSVAGKPLNLDGVVAHGNTDTGILRDAFRRAGVPDEAWRPRLAALQQTMGEQVERNRAELSIETLPRVQAVLAHLLARGAVLGVATGNLARIGRTKLNHCGLFQYFHFGAYSDAFESRTDVFASGVDQARQLAGSDCSICAVGDTPQDVRAAKANGIEVIAVATGIYSYETLVQEQPTRCVTSMADLWPADS